MLLLLDSLNYPAIGQFPYTVRSGTLTANQPHERAAGRAISGGGEFDLPAMPTSSTAVLGVLVKLSGSVPTNGLPLFQLISSLVPGTPQVRCRIRGIAPYAYLQFERGNNADVLLRTPWVPFDRWFYLEVKVTLAGGEGKIVVRLNGVELCRAEGLQTELDPAILRGWDTVRMAVNSSTAALADLYLCNEDLAHGARYAGAFLGKTTASKLTAGPKIGDFYWGSNPATVSRKRLVVLAGQSNMTGRITSNVSSSWRSPNAKIRIWDRITQAPGWNSLRACSNTSGYYGPGTLNTLAGPEMRLAELLAQHYESTGLSTVPETYIVKGVQDGSAIGPMTPDYCWSPTVLGNLYNDLSSPRGCLLGDITAAAGALGGWSNVERVDFFWYQGETDGILESLAMGFYDATNAFLDQIQADIPVPVTFHIVRLHHAIYQGSPGFGIYWLPHIRECQERIARERSDCRLINVDAAPISNDYLHLQADSYNIVGELFYESWLREQPFHQYLNSFDLTLDQQWIGSGFAGKRAAFSIGSGFEDATNTPSIAAKARTLAAADTGGLPVTVQLGDRPFSPITPSSSVWALVERTVASVRAPEGSGDQISLST